jgi:hypothetical protein
VSGNRFRRPAVGKTDPPKKTLKQENIMCVRGFRGCARVFFKKMQNEFLQRNHQILKKIATQRVSGGFPRTKSVIIFANAPPIEASLQCYCDSSARRTFRKMSAINVTINKKDPHRECVKGVSRPRSARAFFFQKKLPIPPCSSPDSPALARTLVRPNQAKSA